MKANYKTFFLPLFCFFILPWVSITNVLAQTGCNCTIEDEDIEFSEKIDQPSLTGWEDDGIGEPPEIGEPEVESLSIELDEVVEYSAMDLADAMLDAIPIVGDVLLVSTIAYQQGKIFEKCWVDDRGKTDKSGFWKCVGQSEIKSVKTFLNGLEQDIKYLASPAMGFHNPDFSFSQHAIYNDHSAPLRDERGVMHANHSHYNKYFTSGQDNCSGPGCYTVMGHYTPAHFNKSPRNQHFVKSYSLPMGDRISFNDISSEDNKVTLLVQIPKTINEDYFKNRLTIAGKGANIDQYYSPSSDSEASISEFYSYTVDGEAQVGEPSYVRYKPKFNPENLFSGIQGTFKYYQADGTDDNLIANPEVIVQQGWHTQPNSSEPVYLAFNVPEITLSKNGDSQVGYVITQWWYQNYRNGHYNLNGDPYLMNAVKVVNNGNLDLKVGYFDFAKEPHTSAFKKDKTSQVTSTMKVYDKGQFLTLRIHLDISAISSEIKDNPLYVSLDYQALPSNPGESDEIFYPDINHYKKKNGKTVASYVDRDADDELNIPVGFDKSYRYGTPKSGELKVFNLFHGLVTDYKAKESDNSDFEVTAQRVSNEYEVYENGQNTPKKINAKPDSVSLLLSFPEKVNLEKISAFSIKKASNPNKRYTLNIKSKPTIKDNDAETVTKSLAYDLRLAKTEFSFPFGATKIEVSDPALDDKYLLNDKLSAIVKNEVKDGYVQYTVSEVAQNDYALLKSWISNSTPFSFLLENMDMEPGEDVIIVAKTLDNENLYALNYQIPEIGEIDYTKVQTISLEDNSTNYYLKNDDGAVAFTSAINKENSIILEPTVNVRGILVVDSTSQQVLGMDNSGHVAWYDFNPFDKRQQWQYEFVNNGFHLYNMHFRLQGLDVALKHTYDNTQNIRRLEAAISTSDLPVQFIINTKKDANNEPFEVPKWNEHSASDLALFRENFNSALAFDRIDWSVKELDADYKDKNQSFLAQYLGAGKYAFVFGDSVCLSADLQLVDLGNWSSSSPTPDVAWNIKVPTSHTSSGESYPPLWLQSVSSKKYLVSTATDWKDRTNMGFTLQDSEPGSIQYFQLRPHGQLLNYEVFLSFDGNALDIGKNNIQTRVHGKPLYFEDALRPKGEVVKMASLSDFCEILSTDDYKLMNNSDFTFSAWINIDEDYQAKDYLILALNQEGQNRNWLFHLKLTNDNDGSPKLSLWHVKPDGTHGQVGAEFTPGNPADYHLVSFVYLADPDNDGVLTNTGQLTLYYDGKSVATGNFNLNGINITSFDVGSMHGKMDDLKIHTRALSLDEINIEFKARRPTYYPLDAQGENNSQVFGSPVYTYELEREYVYLSQGNQDMINLEKDYSNIGLVYQDNGQWKGQDYSIAFWVAPRTFPVNPLEEDYLLHFEELAQLGNDASRANSLALSYDNSGRLKWWFKNTISENVGASLSGSLALNEWTHVALTFKHGQPSFSETFKVYFNGVEQTWSGTYATEFTQHFLSDGIKANHKMTIGTNKAGLRSAYALIDDLNLFGGVALSSAEINDLIAKERERVKYLISNSYKKQGSDQYPMLKTNSNDRSTHWKSLTVSEASTSLREEAIFHVRLQNNDGSAPGPAYKIYNDHNYSANSFDTLSFIGPAGYQGNYAAREVFQQDREYFAIQTWTIAEDPTIDSVFTISGYDNAFSIFIDEDEVNSSGLGLILPKLSYYTPPDANKQKKLWQFRPLKDLNNPVSFRGATIDPNNLIARYRFDVDAKDDAGTFQNHGTMITGSNTQTTLIANSVERWTNFASFDGVDDYIDISTMTGDFSNGFTATFWINVSNASSQYSGFLDIANGYQNKIILELAQGKLHFRVVSAPDSWVFESSNAVIQDGLWMHVGLTVNDQGVFKCYVNGSEVTMVSVGPTALPISLPTVNSHPHTYVGKGENQAPHYTNFHGSADELKIWNIAKTQAEIQTEMQASPGPKIFLSKLVATASASGFLKEGKDAYNFLQRNEGLQRDDFISPAMQFEFVEVKRAHAESLLGDASNQYYIRNRQDGKFLGLNSDLVSHGGLFWSNSDSPIRWKLTSLVEQKDVYTLTTLDQSPDFKTDVEHLQSSKIDSYSEGPYEKYSQISHPYTTYFHIPGLTPVTTHLEVVVYPENTPDAQWLADTRGFSNVAMPEFPTPAEEQKFLLNDGTLGNTKWLRFNTSSGFYLMNLSSEKFLRAPIVDHVLTMTTDGNKATKFTHSGSIGSWGYMKRASDTGDQKVAFHGDYTYPVGHDISGGTHSWILDAYDYIPVVHQSVEWNSNNPPYMNNYGINMMDYNQFVVDKEYAIYYPIKSGESRVMDHTSNQKHGDYKPSSPFVKKFGSNEVAHFNGSSEYIELPTDLGLDFSTGFAFSAWVRFEQEPSASSKWQRIFDFGNGQRLDNLVFARRDVSNDLRFEYYTGTTISNDNLTASGYVDPGVWTLVTLSIGNGDIKIYKNGIPVGNKSITNNPLNITRVKNYIGKSNWSGDEIFKGDMAEIRMWDHAISDAEVLALWNESKDNYKGKDQLLAFYPINTEETTLVDHSGNNYNGVFTNQSQVSTQGNLVVASFNGTNEVATATLDVSETEYAVSLWFKTNEQNGGLYQVYGTASSNALDHSMDRMIYLVNGNIVATITQGTTQQEVRSTGLNLADGKWHHVVHTFGASINGQKLYVDTVMVDSKSQKNSTFTAQTSIALGYAYGWSSPFPVADRYFNGSIDDVRIFSAALGAAEVNSLWDESRLNYHILAHYAVNPGESPGVLKDYGPYANDGTLRGDASSIADGGQQVLSLDGTGDYVELNMNAIKPKREITISTWFKTTQANGIIARWLYYGWELYMAGGQLKAFVDHSIAHRINNVTSTAFYNDGNWHNVAITDDGNVLILYVDGIEVHRSVHGLNSDIYYSNGGLALGRIGSIDGGYFHGELDEIRIYDVALSGSEYLQKYNQEKNNYTGGVSSSRVATERSDHDATESPSPYFNLYPNPASNSFITEFYLPFPEEVTMNITTLDGRVVMNKVEVYGSAGFYAIEIEDLRLKGFKSGIYIVTIQSSSWNLKETVRLMVE